MANPQGFDPETASISDFDASHTPSQAEEPPLPQDEVLTDDDPPTKAEEAAVEDPVTEEEEEEKSDGDSPDLDPELASLGFPELPDELKGNPEVYKRYLETQKGIQKVLDQAKSGKTEAEKALEILKPYQHFVDVIEGDDKAAAANALRFIAEQIQVDLGAPPETSDDDDFEYEGERKAYQRAKAEAIKELEAKFGPFMQEFQQQKQEQAKQTEFQSFIDKEAPSVMGFLAKTESGWGVTKDMVATAAKQFPDLKDDLAKAVKMTFVEEYANHKAGVHAKVRTGPEMLSTSTSKGKVMPSGSPEDWTIHDIANANR